MSSIKKIWRKFSQIFGATVLHPQFFTFRYLYRDMKNEAKSATGTLIDIGCGAKPYKEYFLGNVENYFGIDYPEAPECADTETKDRPEVYADAVNIPIKDGSVDTVILTQVLEHVPDPVQTIGEIRRALKKGGSLIMSVPFLYPIHSAPYDHFRFTRYGIEKILTESGFEIKEIKENGGAVATVVLTINVFLMHKLFNLSANKFTALIAVILVPVVLSVSTALNIIGYVLQPLDTERRFTPNYFVTAVKR